MELSSLLALPSGLEVASMTASDKLLTVRLIATAPSGICPLCAHAATHVRSYYTRLVADVPCAGRHVQLLLRGHRVPMRYRFLSTQNFCRTARPVYRSLGPQNNETA